MKKLRQCLLMFSIEQLKDFVGRNLVDMLLEWDTDDKALFTKAKLADMLLAIHGINLFADYTFRQRIIQTLSDVDLESFRTMLPKGKQIISRNEIVDFIARQPWRKNKISERLMSILELDSSLFGKSKSATSAYCKVSANEQFYELLDYQFIIKQKIIAYLISAAPLAKMIVHMPTGTGKTKTAMHTIIHHFVFNLKKRGLVLWMAHTNELLCQAHATFESTWRHLGVEDTYAHKLWDKFEFEHGVPESGFVFCGFAKLIALSKNNPHVFKKIVDGCHLLVVDEAHKAVAEETRRVIDAIMTKKADMPDRSLIGLTATPGRSTNREVQSLNGMFDNRSIEIDTAVLDLINKTKFQAKNNPSEKDVIKYFQERHVLAKIIPEKLKYKNGLSAEDLRLLKTTANANGYDDFTLEFLSTIGRNKSRNMAILNRLVVLSREQIPTIVFACSVEHGKLLSIALKFKGIANACVFGEMDTEARADVLRSFKDRNDPLNILINYEVLTTGFDATNIRCVFITRPTQSVVLYSQMIGRGLRGPMMGGNEECLLVDIEDNLGKFNVHSAFNHFQNYW